MYICICQGITEEQLKAAASQGHGPQEALKKLGVGESCGVCLIEALNSCQFETASPNEKKVPNFSKSHTKSSIR